MRSSLAAHGIADDEPLTPGIVLASQCSGGGAAVLQPEKRLMLAVLENAAWLLLHGPGHSARARRHAREAADWVASDAVDWPFSFVNVCHALGLAPEWIRAGLQRGAPASDPPASAHFPFRRLVFAGRRMATRRGA